MNYIIQEKLIDENIVIFVCSTIGNGREPKMMNVNLYLIILFIKFINKKKKKKKKIKKKIYIYILYVMLIKRILFQYKLCYL